MVGRLGGGEPSETAGRARLSTNPWVRFWSAHPDALHSIGRHAVAEDCFVGDPPLALTNSPTRLVDAVPPPPPEQWFELNGSPLDRLELDGVILPVTPRIRAEDAKWSALAPEMARAAHAATMACASLVDAIAALRGRDWKAHVVLSAALQHAARAAVDRRSLFVPVGVECCPAPDLVEPSGVRRLDELSPSSTQPSHHHGVFAVAAYVLCTVQTMVLINGRITSPTQPWDVAVARCVNGEEKLAMAWSDWDRLSRAIYGADEDRAFGPQRHWPAWSSVFTFLTAEMSALVALTGATTEPIREGEISFQQALARDCPSSTMYRIKESAARFASAGGRRLPTGTVVFDEKKLRAELRRTGASGLE